VVDISGIRELSGISATDGGYRIGALTRWSEIRDADLPGAFTGLQLAAAEVGGVQVQNAGTIAGNLCNASPAADGVPPLLTLDARVEIRSREGERELPLSEFVVGYRQTALRPGEVVTAVIIPRWDAVSDFQKLGSRTYLVISIAMVAILLETTADDVITAARVAVGACSPVAQRLASLEDHLIGRHLRDDLDRAVTIDHLDPLTPIDDMRATAAYRRDAALTLIRRSLRRLGAP
jgi:CO/xanthine dehydrogenase FAD-binding subunit